MSDTLTPVDELRTLFEASKTDPTSIDHWQLRAQRIDHLNTAHQIVTAVAGRTRLASEQRDTPANEAVDLIDKTLLNVDKRKTLSDAFRAQNPHMYPDTYPTGGGLGGIGAQIRNAIDEVRAGRAESFVEFPEVARTATSGQGSYLVNTAMGNPVSALAARSVVMSLPGVNQINVASGDRIRIPAGTRQRLAAFQRPAH